MQKGSGGAARGVSGYHNEKPPLLPPRIQIDVEKFSEAFRKTSESILKMGRNMRLHRYKKQGLSIGKAPRLGPSIDI